MSRIEETIEKLAATASIQVRPETPTGLFSRWLAITLLATAGLVIFMQPRPDLTEQMLSPLFIAEILSLCGVIATLAFTAVFLCYPDVRQNGKIAFLPLLPLAIFLSLCLYRLANPDTTLIPPPEKVSGIDCALCITVFSLVPGFWMLRTLRQNATTHPEYAGSVSLLTAASVGLLALKIIEPNDSVIHLLQWHVVPTLTLGLIGYFLGRKFLSW